MKISENTCKYIREHADEDVRRLALQGTKDTDVDLQQALQQIAGRQTARQKLPSWAAVDGIFFPPHLNMEQCSSETTARYKQSLVDSSNATGLFADLTGGFGVDFYWMSQGFGRCVYVEQDAGLCGIAEGNFRQLGHECEVCCCDTATYLTTMPHAAVVFLDPARRNEHGGRTYGIADCTPNVLELLPQLTAKADTVLLKLSPMLDWRKAVGDITQVVGDTHQLMRDCCSVITIEVHIVSVDNECKELLIKIRNEIGEMSKAQHEMSNEKGTVSNATAGPRVVCVNLCKDSTQHFAFTATSTATSTAQPISHSSFLISHSSQPISHSSFLISYFLYEPNASIMKAGCFAELERRFAVQQVAPNSHLFLSSVEIADFPGRQFQIIAISSASKKKINQKLTSLESANITVRNFPMTADQLRKKLKLKDGGDTYIFATTLADGQHCLFVCRKLSGSCSKSPLTTHLSPQSE